jgi:hypothetical protein
VTFENRTFIVEAMDRNRIERVKIVNARPAETGTPNERAS